MAKGTKNINIEVTTECWKNLKIISITKDITLQEVVREILEKYIQSKSKKLEIIGE